MQWERLLSICFWGVLQKSTCDQGNWGSRKILTTPVLPHNTPQVIFPQVSVLPVGRQAVFNHVFQLTKQRCLVLRHGLSTLDTQVDSCVVRLSGIEMFPSISKKQNVSQCFLWDILYCIILSSNWALKLYFSPIWSRKSFSLHEFNLLFYWFAGSEKAFFSPVHRGLTLQPTTEQLVLQRVRCINSIP